MHQIRRAEFAEGLEAVGSHVDNGVGVVLVESVSLLSFEALPPTTTVTYPVRSLLGHCCRNHCCTLLHGNALIRIADFGCPCASSFQWQPRGGGGGGVGSIITSPEIEVCLSLQFTPRISSNRQGAPDEPEPAALDLRAAHASLQ